MDNYLNRVISNRYEIQEIIGVGGMAVVYKAYDRVDDRIVAVKILKDEYLANEEYRVRFRNESRAVSVLNHPNIVKVFDVCFGDDMQYIVMEHVEGITLKEFIEKQKVLEWKEALIIVVQILKALQHAHDKGVIHRDIKPQNILLLPNAQIKVTDFGIASFKRGAYNTNDSEAIGSVHYVSPEQARGDYTDEKSDIYSVGVVLYEMLTGKIPFDSDTDEYVALMQLQAEAVKPTVLNSSIPVGLEQITLKAMQKNSSDRYQSAAEFLMDLDEFRRNPDILFDYHYFIDKNPTKFITTKQIFDKNPLRDDNIQNHIQPENDQSPDDYDEDEYDEDDDSSRGSLLPVLIGVTVALVLVAGVVLLGVFGNDIFGKGSDGSSGGFSFFGLFEKDKIEVPNFINMKFEDVLEKYPHLAIENPPQYEYNSTFENGYVCNQSPEAGDKVSKDTVFKLTVATSNEMVLIKDVTGYNSLEAESILRESGLIVELIPQEDATLAEGTVIRTEPTANKYVEYRGTVYVYYATSNNSINMTRVPNVNGWELEAAKEKIVSCGLKVGAVTEGASSPALKGFVISQTPSATEAVNEGVYVNLVVGNGIPATNIAEFKITLPSLDPSATCTIKTYLNDVLYETIPNVSYGLGSYVISFTGSGATNNFKVYCDAVLAYSGDIDFTTTPSTISNVRSYQVSTKIPVPDLTGLSESEAETALQTVGFNRYKFVYEESDTVAVGYVISQSPIYSETAKYSTATIITVTVSLGSSSETPSTEIPSTEPASSENPSGESPNEEVTEPEAVLP